MGSLFVITWMSVQIITFLSPDLCNILTPVEVGENSALPSIPTLHIILT